MNTISSYQGSSTSYIAPGQNQVRNQLQSQTSENQSTVTLPKDNPPLQQANVNIESKKINDVRNQPAGEENPKKASVAVGQQADISKSVTSGVKEEKLPEVPPEQRRKDIDTQLQNLKNKDGKSAYDVYQSLSPEDKKKFDGLSDKFYSPSMGEYSPAGTSSDLAGLLLDGKLQNKDSQGKTLLDNLDSLNNQKLGKGLDKDAIMYEVMSKTNNPEMEMGKDAKTPSEKLDKSLVKDNPAEYARIISGLAGEKGEVKLQDGTVLKRGDKEIKDPNNMSRQLFASSVDNHMMNSADNIKSEDKRKDILNNINNDPKAKEAYEKMSDKEKQDFMALSEKTYNGGIKIMDKEIPPSVNSNLTTLLNSGKLNDKDKNGQTLLGNLSAMGNQKFADGLNGTEVLKETIANVARPDGISQKNKGTCTVTTLEYLNAKNSPSEYVRITAGLTSEKGEVELRNGDTLKREDGIVKDDGSGRTNVDRIYQASMMEYGNKGLDYDNEKDTNIKTGLFGGKTDKGGGMSQSDFTDTMNAVLPYESKYREYNRSDRQRKEMEEALAGGKEFTVSMKWADKGEKHAYHELAVEKMDDKYVYLRNPWGDGENGTDKGVKRELMPPGGTKDSGGHIRISKEDFYKNLDSYSIPVK